MNSLEVTQAAPIRLLFSYHFYRYINVLREFEACFGDTPRALFCDSGAFSSFSIGVHVDCQEYIDWLAPMIHGFETVAALDVIGDPTASHKNFEMMRSAYPTANILPTFHVGEPWELLKQYCRESSTIALGGMVPFVSRRKMLRRWLDAAFALIPKGTRVHGFGMTTWELVHPYPWTSLDSSTWITWSKFRELDLFDPDKCNAVRVDMRASARLSLLRHARLLERYGLRISDIKPADFDQRRLGCAALQSLRLAEMTLSAQRKCPLAVYAVLLPGSAGGHAAIASYLGVGGRKS